MNETKKDRIIKRIKHYTPELIVGATVVAGVAAMVYIKKEIDNHPTEED